MSPRVSVQDAVNERRSQLSRYFKQCISVPPLQAVVKLKRGNGRISDQRYANGNVWTIFIVLLIASIIATAILAQAITGETMFMQHYQGKAYALARAIIVNFLFICVVYRLHRLSL
jgi:hypothetical protein